MTIKLQQDNTTPHRAITNTDPDFRAAVAAAGGLNITVVDQPAQSPDTNVLELGYFNYIESHQKKKKKKKQPITNTITELVGAVEESFMELDRLTLNELFVTHQRVLEAIIMNDGGNKYRLPHMIKDELLRRGQLPVPVSVSDDLSDAKLEALHASAQQQP
jgi:hypothetical protein